MRFDTSTVSLVAAMRGAATASAIVIPKSRTLTMAWAIDSVM